MTTIHNCRRGRRGAHPLLVCGVCAALLWAARSSPAWCVPPTSPAPAPLGTPGTPAQPGMAWARTLADALAQGKATGRPVMIDFYTDWCGWCHKLDSDTYTDPAVTSLAGTAFITVKVDAEKEGAAAAARYKVNSYPTILFINAGTGAVERRISGYLPAEPFRAALQSVLDARRELPLLKAKLAADPGDTATAVRLVTLYTDAGDDAGAAAALTTAEKSDPKNAKGLLTPVYLALGKQSAENGAFPAALALFKKAADTGATAEERATGRLYVGACRAEMKNIAGAAAAFQTVEEDKAVSAGLRGQARDFLARIAGMGKESGR